MKPAIIIGIAVVVGIAAYAGMSALTEKTPEQIIQSYNDKAQHLIDLDNEAEREVDKYLEQLTGQMIVCKSKHTLDEIITCVDDPQLTKKIEALLDDYEKTVIEMRAMELGGNP